MTDFEQSCWNHCWMVSWLSDDKLALDAHVHMVFSDLHTALLFTAFLNNSQVYPYPYAYMRECRDN